MSTAWTLLASEVCTDALQHLGVLGEGESASGEQIQTALRGLDVVLKELPLAGYLWPKLSAESALAWVSGQTVNLPADYYGYPVVCKTVNGQRVPLIQIPHATWVQMLGRDAPGEPTHCYVSPANVLSLYPTPTVNPNLTIQYQAIVDDAALAVTPNVLQTWKGALGWGVADEVGMRFGAPAERRQEIAARWREKRSFALQSAVASEPISFSVQD